jgi:DNA processing protein
VNRATHDAERFDRLRLLRSPRVGPVAYRQLLGRFGSAAAALAALPDLSARGRSAGGTYQPAPVARIEVELDAVARSGAFHLIEGDPRFPPLLAHADGAPPILIARGEPALATRSPVAIVGARNASAGACRLARGMAAALATAGHAVVSGLARGVDGAAHEGALAAGAAGTIAVLANGLDVVFPREHAALQARVGVEGLLLTEYPPGTEPLARQFPARNRIIAGLALGTVVAEAAVRSGSLLTARLAAELGREVMAIPGSPLDPRSQGCNGLIRDGAILVQDAAEVIEAISGFGPIVPMARVAGGGVSERALAWTEEQGDCAGTVADDPALTGDIARVLGHSPVPIDEVVRASGAGVAAVQQALVELELAGRLVRHAGGRVSLAD